MSNLHVTLDEANKHTPKGFDPAVSNTRPWKDEQSLSTYTENMQLPKAINFVDGTVAPPTTSDGDIYVLTGSGVIDAGWGTATFGNWVRFTNAIAAPITPSAGYLCFDSTASAWKEFDGTVWASAGGGAAPSGPFAIFDSLGVPTYYTTLALVIASASSGDTIQQFADVTETVSSNALPANVNWNLNGFTYEKTSGSYAISIPANSTNRITNGRIFANGSGNCIDTPSSNEDIYCDGLTLESTAEAIRGNANVNIHNATIIGSSNTLPIVNAGNYHNCIMKGTGSAKTTDVCQDLTRCEVISNNTHAVYRLLGTAYDCRIHSSGGIACGAAAGGAFRGVGCTITSDASHAINTVTVETEDCYINGGAETGITSSNGFSINCTIIGVSIDFAYRTVFGTQKVERCTIVNSAGRGIDRGANSELINCVVRSTFNSANGDAVRVNTGLVAGSAPVITNCSLEVVNTSANYLYSSGATMANYANVVSIDKLVVTTPVNANITQGNAVSDAYGNNF